MTSSLIAWWREAGSSRLLTALTVSVAHLGVVLMPGIAAAQQASQPPAPVLSTDPWVRAQQRLQPALEAFIQDNRGFRLGKLFGLAPDLGELAPVLDDLESAHQRVLADFTRVGAHLADKNLPESVRKRHAQTVADYRRAHQTLMDRLTTLNATSQPAEAAEAILEELKEQSLGRSHQPLDYERLPFGVNRAEETRPPLLDEDALKQRFPAEPLVLASANEHSAMLLAAGAMGLPTEADLAATTDVQISPEIEALASQLDNSPVAIYNWVRNHIEYLPLYLSLQGSQRTLETRRGNAFDISSLLIALLRAADIPARYRYGTVRIPEEKVRNWLGDLESPHAALDLLGQGGIPALGRTEGGQITAIDLEHIWVEVWVDYYPSRGARNIQPDAWIPMDAAFKQYDYAEGLPLQDEVPFDAQGFVDDLLETAVIDEEAGTVQNLDTDLIETTFQTYLDQVNSHIDSNHPDATVGEVIGSRTIRALEAPVLAGSLPYQPLAQLEPWSTLPDELRGQYSFTLYASPQDETYDAPAFVFTDSLPNLANTTLSLSFEPATEEDRETIESYLSEPDENGDIDPNDLPESLPGYLINLKAELRRNGEVIHTAGPFPMGTELASRTEITRLTGGTVSAVNYPIAGEYHALGINLPGGQGESLEAIQDRLEATRDQLEAEAFETLTKDDLVGDLLTAAVNGYFAVAATQMELLNRQSTGQLLMQPGYGAVNTVLNPQYAYGTPRQVFFDGLGVDIDAVVHSAVGKDADNQTRINLVQQMGTQLSALEHRILEVLFTDQDNPGEAASAVKALATAAAQGQTIHTLDQSNVQYLNQITTTEQIKADIRNGINAGLTATIHQQPVNIGGWIGTGYTLTDPETGAGAYRIGNGQNGAAGFFGFVLVMSILMLSTLALIIALDLIVSGVVFATFNVLVGGVLFYKDLKQSYSQCSGLEYLSTILALLIFQGILSGAPDVIGAAISSLGAMFSPSRFC